MAKTAKTLPVKILIIASVILAAACSAKKEKDTDASTLIYKDDFDTDLSNWMAETESTGTTVEIKNGKLVIDAPGGATVWLNKKLEGDVVIEFTRTVVVEDGPNDRLSDFNQFWMATDPQSENLFTRNGKFSEYDSLSLYYVGFGGNSNSTTRFRKYKGNGERELLAEYTDEEHLLKPNKAYKIKITCTDGLTTFLVDGDEYFSFNDEQPLVSGYFGFRLVKSRQEIDDFKVSRSI